MQLDSPRQQLTCLGIVLAFLAVLLVVIGWIVTSLSDQNAAALGGWLNDNTNSIGTALYAVVPAVATYLFGRRVGRKAGKTEAYNSAIATVIGKTGDEAAKTLHEEASAHNLRVTVGP
jgi:hypothetical protein